MFHRIKFLLSRVNLARENIRFSSLFAAGDVSLSDDERLETSAVRRLELTILEAYG